MSKFYDFWIFQDNEELPDLAKNKTPWAIHVFARREGKSKYYECEFYFYAEWIKNSSKKYECTGVKIQKNNVEPFINVVKNIHEMSGKTLTDKDELFITNELVFMMENTI